MEATEFGFTLGIHTRLSERALGVIAASCVGNTYVNRNMVGAVVGVQPFGGEGLSGTGPKASSEWTARISDTTYRLGATLESGNRPQFR
jgi:delta 1-pyrroline-5-carboxylate dehydrogenase